LNVVLGGNQQADAGVVMAGLDAWVYSRPYQDAEGGGDVYYVSNCATGRITRLLVADVTGHGAAVAATGAKLRLLMRRYVNHIRQEHFVLALNRELVSLSREGGFATAAVVSFFAPTCEVLLCSAGHPPPLLYRSRRQSWSAVQSDCPASAGIVDIPLGITELSSYRQQSLRLDVGDLLMLYSDSLIETTGDDGRLLGVAGLLEAVSTLDASAADMLIPALLARIGAGPDSRTGDDVTILLVRPNRLATWSRWRQRLAAPLRMIAALSSAAVRTGEPPPWPEMSIANIGGAMLPALNRRRRRRQPKC
jgi:serine phosphatase RsbU (regulator of sigma subunit)